MSILDFDAVMTQAVNSPAGVLDGLDWSMINLSRVAVPLLVLVVTLQWWKKGPDRAFHRHTIVSAGFAFALGLLANQVILLFIQRPRPYVSGLTHLIISPTVDPSFPSDHATATFSIAAAFILNGATRQGTVLLLLAGLVGYSRVFVGTHYVSDVLGGAVIGVSAALIVRFVYQADSKIDRFLVKIL